MIGKIEKRKRGKEERKRRKKQRAESAQCMRRKKYTQRQYLCHAGFNHFRAFERTTRAEQFDDVFLRDVAVEVAHQNTEALERGRSRVEKKR